MIHVLYNPIAGGGAGEANARAIEKLFPNEKCAFYDVRPTNLSALTRSLGKGDRVILAGGDGTLNHFVNRLPVLPDGVPFYYYAAGSGNDFLRDVKPDANGLVPLNAYTERLPTVTVRGKTRRFLNGVGYGIDGYCCEEGDRLREKGNKNINYAAIAIKGLLGKFKSREATVEVDGEVKSYRNVWLAPVMNGRFYGGGMMIAPNQDRLNGEGTVSVVVLHCRSKLKTLIAFPGVFKGEHVRRTDMVEIRAGRRIVVEFDRPTPLQIDGETVTDVRKYAVTAAVPAVREQIA